MAEIINGTCIYEYKTRERAYAFRIFNLAYASFFLLVIGIFGILWYRRQKTIYLNRRGGSLIFVSCLGMIVLFMSGALNRYDSNLFSCTFDFTIYFLSLPAVAIPLNVRLILWVNQIKYNYAIARTVAEKGLRDFDFNAPELRRPRFYASKTFGLMLCFALLLPFTALSVGIAEYGCTSCTSSGFISAIFFLVTAFLILGSAAYSLFRFRNIPDEIGLRKETLYAFSLTAGFGIPMLLLYILDIGSLETTSPQVFSFAVLIDVAFLMLIIATVPYQVVRARYHKPTSAVSKQGLDNLLESEQGIKYFELYLATELSIENILFYKTVNRWKDGLNGTRKNSNPQEYQRIVDTFIAVNSPLEINIGYTVRQEVLDMVKSGKEIPADIFDEAYYEVYQLMANQSYEKFLLSDFYKMYTGEMTADSVFWVHGTNFTTIMGRHHSEEDLSGILTGSLSGEGLGGSSP